MRPRVCQSEHRGRMDQHLVDGREVARDVAEPLVHQQCLAVPRMQKVVQDLKQGLTRPPCIPSV